MEAPTGIVAPRLRQFARSKSPTTFTAHPGRLAPVDPAAVWTITFHVLELVAVAVVLLLYLLIKVWRRI
jgi:hypothetical protein